MSLSNVDASAQSKTDSKTGNIVSLDERLKGVVLASPTSDKPAMHFCSSSATDYCPAVFIDHMTVAASVEIDDLVWIRGHFSSRVRDQIVASIRKLLCQEFGRNMIQRDELIFVVRHRRVETLIEGLMRVRFYANQVLLPEFNIFGERVDQNGVSVTWGVGRSPEEASLERVKKRKRRNLRRR